MTQLSIAKDGDISESMHKVADIEGVSTDFLKEKIAAGEIVLLQNIKRKDLFPVGIGTGLRIKINANIGTSKDLNDLELEINKLKEAIKYGAHTVMDLSTGGDLTEIRKRMIEESNVPIGTVPVYQGAYYMMKKGKSFAEMKVKDFFNLIQEQAEQGVDFMTIHCGVTRSSVNRLKKDGRLAGLVSRGGSLMVEWMEFNKAENPFYQYYDDLLAIAYDYDITLSLGDGFRPGAIDDSTDRPQVQELIILGELVERAREGNVQVMVEGPGHIPINEIETNILLEKKLCKNAPFYVLGPLVTDVAPGYDHIVGAIGGSIAAVSGADYLCYVTPAEHLKLPDVSDVREGVIASRIAAHVGDMIRRNEVDWDYALSKARKDFHWDEVIKLALDPVKAETFRSMVKPQDNEVCSMCGDFCAIKKMKKVLGGGE
ncbi:MAG: phosphomethylpyrimidine synthase ThiC [Candidatus Coatesbacteria bacterium]|nr:phosphomethylpyrimidine synthase ThiC [Candidatus Coatesbacteria bacterium]